MELARFLQDLRLTNKVLSITISSTQVPVSAKSKYFCSIALLNDALMGETLCFHAETKGCPGAKRGMGFDDGVPGIKGGFGNFIANGCGEGFPEGERIKQTAEIAENMLELQPTNVLESNSYLIVKPYETTDAAACVTFLCNSDQMAALIHLFCYNKGDYDNVIAPMSSGCASIFRIPLDERKKENPRAVIGNVDLFSRVHFPKGSFFFTIPAESFRQMLADADNSFMSREKWKELRERIHSQNE